MVGNPAGLCIISNLDEVAFIQNLVFYIEAAYKVAVSSGALQGSERDMQPRDSQLDNLVMGGINTNSHLI